MVLVLLVFVPGHLRCRKVFSSPSHAFGGTWRPFVGIPLTVVLGALGRMEPPMWRVWTLDIQNSRLLSHCLRGLCCPDLRTACRCDLSVIRGTCWRNCTGPEWCLCLDSQPLPGAKEACCTFTWTLALRITEVKAGNFSQVLFASRWWKSRPTLPAQWKGTVGFTGKSLMFPEKP